MIWKASTPGGRQFYHWNQICIFYNARNRDGSESRFPKQTKFIEEGKTIPKINQLEVFIEKVNNDFDNSLITQVVRDNLVVAAENLILDLQL